MEGAPHSIAEELWHTAYWQDLFLGWARGERLRYPAHAEEGWPVIDSMTDPEWQALVDRFLAGLREAAELARDTTGLAEQRSGRDDRSVLDLVYNVPVHNAYHLGRIVQLRQMLSIWPPPGGGDTW